MKALDDPERSVRIEVVKALASLGVPAIAPLMQVFREGNLMMKTSAMEALWMLGQPATTPLIMVLKDDQSDVRKRAALLLGEIGDQKAVDHLTSLLNDENIAVRREAFEALEMIKKRNAYIILSIIFYQLPFSDFFSRFFAIVAY